MALALWIWTAVVLIVVGALLAFTDVLFLEGLGGVLVGIGWFILAIGIIVLVALLIRHLIFDRSTPRRRRIT